MSIILKNVFKTNCECEKSFLSNAMSIFGVHACVILQRSEKVSLKLPRFTFTNVYNHITSCQCQFYRNCQYLTTYGVQFSNSGHLNKLIRVIVIASSKKENRNCITSCNKNRKYCTPENISKKNRT